MRQGFQHELASSSPLFSVIAHGSLTHIPQLFAAASFISAFSGGLQSHFEFKLRNVGA
jgi:hypothetical protein